MSEYNEDQYCQRQASYLTEIGADPEYSGDEEYIRYEYGNSADRIIELIKKQK